MATQAIEAQEPGVEIRPLTRAVNSITYQTLFKYYTKLSGMTVRHPTLCHTTGLKDRLLALKAGKRMLPLQALAILGGTAISAEEEFFEVYKLHIIQIPTHKPSIRIDHPPRVYIR